MININLLPEDILIHRKQNSKYNKITNIAVASLIFVIIATIGLILIRLDQSNDLKATQLKTQQTEERVTSLSNREVQMALLKQRLQLVAEINKEDDLKQQIFSFLVSAVPSDVELSNITLSKNGTVTIQATAKDATVFENLVQKLASEKQFKFNPKIDMDGISIGQDGVLRFNLKLSPV